jgi:hypothetical protein
VRLRLALLYSLTGVQPGGQPGRVPATRHPGLKPGAEHTKFLSGTTGALLRTKNVARIPRRAWPAGPSTRYRPLRWTSEPLVGTHCNASAATARWVPESLCTVASHCESPPSMRCSTVMRRHEDPGSGTAILTGRPGNACATECGAVDRQLLNVQLTTGHIGVSWAARPTASSLVASNPAGDGPGRW